MRREVVELIRSGCVCGDCARIRTDVGVVSDIGSGLPGVLISPELVECGAGGGRLWGRRGGGLMPVRSGRTGSSTNCGPPGSLVGGSDPHHGLMGLPPHPAMCPMVPPPPPPHHPVADTFYCQPFPPSPYYRYVPSTYVHTLHTIFKCPIQSSKTPAWL